jgi:hypothetical protein
MEDILKNIKELFSWIWTPAKTPEEKIIKRYDILIALCVVFMIGYFGLFILNLDYKINFSSTNISSINRIDQNFNPAFYNSPDASFYTTNALTDKEFYVGEIVGVKYFSVFGLVIEKTLGTWGFTYTIRYENTEHDLMNEDCYSWELYRPPPGTVSISVLRQ